MWLLDTNICIELIRRKPPTLLARLRAVDVGALALSSITVAELQYGVAKSAQPERNALALAAFLAPFHVISFDDEAAAAYGPVRAALERAGTPIGSMDLLLAAHALAAGRTLVTNNVREFERVEGLRVEDWTR